MPLPVAKDDCEAVTVGVVETLAVEVEVDDPVPEKVPLVEPEGVSCNETTAVLVGEAVFEALVVEVTEITAVAELHVDTVPVIDDVLHEDTDGVDEDVEERVADVVEDPVSEPDCVDDCVPHAVLERDLVGDVVGVAVLTLVEELV